MAAEQNGPVQSISLGAASAAIPALPSGGSDISSFSPFTEIANALGEDDVNFDVVEEALDIEGPLQANRVAEVLFKRGVKSVMFALYEINGTGLDIDGTITLGSDIAEPTTTAAYNAMMIEYKGIGVAYFPKVRISWEAIEAGIKKLAGMKFTAKVFGTAAIPSGVQWKDFQ